MDAPWVVTAVCLWMGALALASLLTCAVAWIVRWKQRRDAIEHDWFTRYTG